MATTCTASRYIGVVAAKVQQKCSKKRRGFSPGDARNRRTANGSQTIEGGTHPGPYQAANGEQPAMNGLTTSEAAERLGIPKTTLSTWLGQLPIPHDTDSRGRRRLDDEALALLETVKTLRGDDCGYQTIRRRIGPLTEPDQVEAESNPTTNETQPEQAPTLDTDAFMAQVVAAVSAQTDLAERYARVAHQVGRLEADNDHLRAQLAELKDKVAQLEAPSPTPARPWWKLWG